MKKPSQAQMDTIVRMQDYKHELVLRFPFSIARSPIWELNGSRINKSTATSLKHKGLIEFSHISGTASPIHHYILTTAGKDIKA